ncbi:MAG: Galactokinase [Cytophagales bacterium]|jgi:galactokinase|nr:galactokinase [Bacteroidota bacterium]MBS1980294.1 galactokinase [Bacteroidota bacterium]WHZ08820.1 MAG: Galactokinase [Cytophagales bacterium]
MTFAAVTELFTSRFAENPTLFRAPGRINLMGEHTDYNGGFVMPSAIDKYFLFAMAPNGTNQFHFTALDLNESISFSSDQLKPGHHWSNYLMGVVDGFIRREKKIYGANVVFTSNIPANAGLSSSAALCSGLGFALNDIFECGLATLDLALIAQESEHRFAGAKVGIMDMYASLFSKEGSIMLLDCQSNTHRYLPFKNDGLELLLIDTKVKHTLASSAYNNRRQACEKGVEIIRQKHQHVRSLRDVSVSMLKDSKVKIEEEVFQRCLYVVQEMQRTQQAVDCLRTNDSISLGQLMYQTHWGLSKMYEVSCDESDWLVTFAQENGITGARQIGGGFGGCVLCLLYNDLKKTFIEKVKSKYVAHFKKEPDFYSVKLTDGVSRASGD